MSEIEFEHFWYSFYIVWYLFQRENYWTILLKKHFFFFLYSNNIEGYTLWLQILLWPKKLLLTGISKICYQRRDISTIKKKKNVNNFEVLSRHQLRYCIKLNIVKEKLEKRKILCMINRKLSVSLTFFFIEIGFIFIVLVRVYFRLDIVGNSKYSYI